MSAGRARHWVRGVYAVTPDLPDTQELLGLTEAALKGGIRIVQYRNKVAPRTEMLAQARALKEVCAAHDAALIINDHLDLALAVDANGIHLGREDGSAADARRALGPEKIIGISCYDSLENGRVAERAGADYVAFGSFFPSRVKPGAVRASIELIQKAKEELSVPIVAIGGITADNAPELVRAGTDAIAVISALFGAEDVTAAARRLNASFQWLA